jgi:hypothetical protein
MKHQKYHTVGTVPNPIEKSRKEATSIPIIHHCFFEKDLCSLLEMESSYFTGGKILTISYFV